MSASNQTSGAGSPVAGGRYLEDFAVGQTYGSGRLRVDEERIKSFAAEFDPQPFHLNAEAARKSILGGLAASGWHTAALTMRLLVESEIKPAGGIVGVGFDELRWPQPVRPGDEMRLELRPSKSRPTGTDQGRDDRAQPKRRDGASSRREPDGAAPFRQHAKRKLGAGRLKRRIP